jgi:hypothetical protein
MSLMPGERAKFVTAADNLLADQIRERATIDVMLTKNKFGVRRAAIIVWRTDESHIDIDPVIQTKEYLEAMQEAQQDTQVLDREPLYFDDPGDRSWLAWCYKQALAIFDELGTDANIIIKAPGLNVRDRIPRSKVMKYRSQPERLFWVLGEIDRMFDQQFEFDPWRNTVHRGKIGVQ